MIIKRDVTTGKLYKISLTLSPVLTGEKVEFNMVDNVSCVALAPYTLVTMSAISATVLTATSC